MSGYIDRFMDRAVHWLGRCLFWIACTSRARSTAWGGRLLGAVGHLCVVRAPAVSPEEPQP